MICTEKHKICTQNNTICTYLPLGCYGLKLNFEKLVNTEDMWKIDKGNDDLATYWKIFDCRNDFESKLLIGC